MILAKRPRSDADVKTCSKFCPLNGQMKVCTDFISTRLVGIFNLVHKEWELEKETKLNSEFLLIKSSGIIFIFLRAFYLIIWPMTQQRNFLKIAILK